MSLSLPGTILGAVAPLPPPPTPFDELALRLDGARAAVAPAATVAPAAFEDAGKLAAIVLVPSAPFAAA
jgi:hypothetical protein